MPSRQSKKTVTHRKGEARQESGVRAGHADLKNDCKVLKCIQLFQFLSEDELQTILPKVVFREFTKGQVILREQHTNEFMYIIIRGKVKISQISKDGKEGILSLHNAGEFFGEMSLIDGATTPATVAALEPSTVAIISRSDFYELLYTHTKVLDNLLNILCCRLRESWKKIQMLTFHNASDRVKMLLMMFADTHGEKTDRGTVLKIKLIHQDIADMTGLTRETVTRVLDRFVKSGEITILKNKLIKLNPEFQTIAL